MASGDPLITLYAWSGVAPATNGATFSTVQGTSTNNEFFQVADFDDTTDEFLDFPCVMPDHYAGTTGITCTVVFTHSHATTGPTWGLACRRIADDAEDIDTTAHTYVFNTVAAGAPSVIGEVGYDDITFTDGADMDSVVAGDLFILRAERDALGDATGDARLISIHITET
jgi:hypothetical protein